MTATHWCTTPATTTTPPVTVVCCSTSLSLTMTVTMVPTLMGLPVASGQHDVVLLPPLMLRDTGHVVGLTTVQQQQSQSQMPPQAYANYAMGPVQVSFSLRVEPPTNCLYMYVSVMVYAFCFKVPCWMPYLPIAAQPLGFVLLQSIPMAGICAPW